MLFGRKCYGDFCDDGIDGSVKIRDEVIAGFLVSVEVYRLRKND